MASNGTRATPRRTQLSRETIVDAALTISAAGEQLTFRALGGALDADPTAVYRHFRNKDELLRAVYDRMLAEVRAQVDETATWRNQLRELATLAWRASERHPRIGVDAPMLTSGGPGELGCMELILALLREAGLGGAELVRFYGVISSYVLAISANISARRLDANTLGPGVDGSWHYDLRGVDTQRFPEVAANRHQLTTLSDREVYPAAMDMLLDAVEAAAARSTKS